MVEQTGFEPVAPTLRPCCFQVSRFVSFVPALLEHLYKRADCVTDENSDPDSPEG
jgi:hypothetical protein